MSSVVSLRVKFFASLRESTGTDAWACDMTPGAAKTATLNDLLRQLGEQFGADAMVALQADNVRIAVNQSLVDTNEHPLQNGDEVAFLPPVTGG